MTKKEAKIKALVTIWGWATNHCEGIEKGELSDALQQDVENGRYSETDAKKIQREFFLESEIIHTRLRKIRNGK